MKKNLALVRRAQKRFKLINEIGFDGCLPKIKIEIHTSSKDFDGTFVSFNPPSDGKPYIVLYKDISDEILLHEMTHYYLYILYLPSFKLSAQMPADAKRFMKKYQHTKEFWEVQREAMSKLI